MISTSTKVDVLVERLAASLATITRPATIRRLHQHLADEAGIQLERSSYLVLKQLVLDGPTRITDLAAEFGVEPSTISRHVSRLEQDGLLQKKPDADDKRVALAEATERGIAAVTSLEHQRNRLNAAILEGWDESDAAALVDLIERFYSELSAVVETK